MPKAIRDERVFKKLKKEANAAKLAVSEEFAVGALPRLLGHHARAPRTTVFHAFDRQDSFLRSLMVELGGRCSWVMI